MNQSILKEIFNREMALLLQEELDACAKDASVRAIVLTGSGKAFCAGQDLKEVTDPDLNPGFKKILEEHYNPINIVVAHEKVSFIQAFSKIGLVPDSAGTFFLPRLIGFGKASALAMLGDKIGADEAEKMGMIYKSVSLDEFEDTINELALKLANMPTKALGLIKELFNQSITNTLEEQLVLESKLQIEAASSEDYREGVAAFIEKRKPEFKGR